MVEKRVKRKKEAHDLLPFQSCQGEKGQKRKKADRENDGLVFGFGFVGVLEKGREWAGKIDGLDPCEVRCRHN